MHRILLIDNHDSFTYNLVEVLRETHLCEVRVVLYEFLEDADIRWAQGVILSPGPGLPSHRSGFTSLIKQIAGNKPLLGVCLGHQAIAEAFGARIVPIGKIIHGESSPATINSHNSIYSGLNAEIMVGRYHSWVVDPESMPAEFEVTAQTTDNLVMSIAHKHLNVHGVQYHPESILTQDGKKILSNWLNFCI